MGTATTRKRGARISIKPICFSRKVKFLIAVSFRRQTQDNVAIALAIAAPACRLWVAARPSRRLALRPRRTSPALHGADQAAGRGENGHLRWPPVMAAATAASSSAYWFGAGGASLEASEAEARPTPVEPGLLLIPFDIRLRRKRRRRGCSSNHEEA
jgi:hypothetical protein